MKLSNRLSFAVIIAALIIGSSLVFQTGAGPKLFGYPLLGLAGFLAASILWVYGCSSAFCAREDYEP